MPLTRVLIVGGGLTACTLAHRLAREGVASTILERLDVPGGLIRSEHLGGVLYEPHGSHIFHTEDQEVWELANAMTPFNDPRHRVDIVVEGKVLNWPILVSDLDAYTEKQWGRPAHELSAQWAPRRVSVRWDDDPFLFPDPHQGWPAGPNGYTDLIDGLLDDVRIELRTGVDVSLATLEGHARDARAELVVLTCPLDVFAGACLGELEWRGILVRNVHLPHVEHAQGAMVVNHPGREYPFIRIHETEHASRQRCEGTVLGLEFTGAPTRYHPIELPHTRALNARYQDHLREQIGPGRTFFAGRLATYAYLDMDDCMRQALDAAEEVLAAVRSRT